MEMFVCALEAVDVQIRGLDTLLRGLSTQQDPRDVREVLTTLWEIPSALLDLFAQASLKLQGPDLGSRTNIL